MALSFSDADLRTISSDILNIPQQIVLLDVQKTQALAQQQDALGKDNANAVFYNNFKNIVDRYYDEKRWLNGVQHTSYDTANIDPAARQTQGNVHFPTSPVWMGMSPKRIDSVNGSPTSSLGAFETVTFTQMATQIALLKSGYTDGSTTGTTGAAYSGGASVTLATGTFLAGQRVVIDSGNKNYFATITTVTTSAGTPAVTTLGLSVVTAASTTSTLPSGARIRNFHPGFSNTEREGTTTPYAPELMAYWQSLIDPQVTPWQTALQNQQTALNANDATGADTAEITAAKTNVTNALSTLSTWFASPAAGSGIAKYGDTRLGTIETLRTTRTTAVPARVAQIDTRLGSVDQNSDGTYSGSGQRLSLFKWIDFRISKAGGSLFNYYNFNVVIDFIDKKVIQTNDKKAEFEAQMIVTALSENPSGTNTVKVASITGLSVGNNVKIIDDTATLASTTATITAIDGLSITLSTSISKYTTDAAARLVRIL